MTGQTILLTGITGFIAKRIALDLLNAGYDVVGSLRKPDRADEVRQALRPMLVDAATLDRLRFVELDLLKDDGWNEAMDGIEAVIHTASPFPSGIPKDPDDLIRPAVDGALRALRAAEAQGVRRVVLTSSCAAVMNRTFPPGHTLTEDDWTDPDSPLATPYDRSKTLAERAAWDFVAKHPMMQLTTINPGLVLGTPLDRHYGTSLELVERFLAGNDPALPDIGFPVVDLANVSAMHLAALRRPETIGRRYIAAEAWVPLIEMTRDLARAFPDRRITTRKAPSLLVRLVALWDRTARLSLPTLGRHLEISNQRAREEMGIIFTPWRMSLRESADFLLAADG